MKPNNLTSKQRRFIDCYSGNATEAARLAGYAHPQSQGQRLLNNVEIKKAIAEREQHESRTQILTRQERQEMWTRIASGKEPDRKLVNGEVIEIPVAMRHRLKALECLAKSEGDFMTNLNLSTGLEEELANMSMEEMQERVKRLEEDGVLELLNLTDRENDAKNS